MRIQDSLAIDLSKSAIDGISESHKVRGVVLHGLQQIG